MPVDEVDSLNLEQSKAVIFGSPTHDSTQNCPSGGGTSFAEMTIIANLLIVGMLVYPGGVTSQDPDLHFCAVSWQAPESKLYVDRCTRIGENIAS